MRLWAQQLLSVLPDKQLASQHRECCALRGRGWGKKHATVDYVFTYGIEELSAYHLLVMKEMRYRNVHPDKSWYNPTYRGQVLGCDSSVNGFRVIKLAITGDVIYPEHNDDYLIECLDNLISKLRTKLEKYMTLYGSEDIRTIMVSDELQVLIGIRVNT